MDKIVQNAGIGKREIWGVWLEDCKLIAGRVAQISMDFEIASRRQDAFKVVSNIVTCQHGLSA
jgi:hypothetical protein